MHLGSLGEEGRHTGPNDETGGGAGRLRLPGGVTKRISMQSRRKTSWGAGRVNKWRCSWAKRHGWMDGWIDGRVRRYLAKGRNPPGGGDYCGSGWGADGRGSEGTWWKQMMERSILGQTGRRLWHTELTLEALTSRPLVTPHPSHYSVREKSVTGRSADVSCLMSFCPHLVVVKSLTCCDQRLNLASVTVCTVVLSHFPNLLFVQLNLSVVTQRPDVLVAKSRRVSNVAMQLDRWNFKSEISHLLCQAFPLIESILSPNKAPLSCAGNDCYRNKE